MLGDGTGPAAVAVTKTLPDGAPRPASPMDTVAPGCMGTDTMSSSCGTR